MSQLYFKQFTNHIASEWLVPKLEAAQFEWNFVGIGKFIYCHWSSWTAVFKLGIFQHMLHTDVDTLACVK